MKCRWCNGKGDYGTYNPNDPYWRSISGETEAEAAEDPGVTLCDFCEGTGRVPLGVLAWRWAESRLNSSSRWVRLRTRFGLWWWWQVTRPRKVARLARTLDLHALEKLRANRTKRLMQFVKAGDPAMEPFIEAERRLVAEAAHAVERKLHV